MTATARTASPPTPRSSGVARWRLAATLVVVGSIVLLVTIVGLWARVLVLDTGAWTKASGRVLEDPAVRTALSHTIVDRLYERAQPADLLRSQLPGRTGALAGPAVALARTASYDAVDRLLASPKFQDAWVTANRTAHGELLDIINGKSSAIRQQSGGKVVLDIRPLLLLTANSLGFNGTVVQRIPESRTTFDLRLERQLDQASATVRAIKRIVRILVVLSLVLFAGAIWAGWRQRARVFRWIAAGLVVDGLLLLVLRAVSGQALARRVGTTQESRVALEHAWQIVSAALQTTGWVLAIAGIALWCAVWVVVGARSGRIAGMMDRAGDLARRHHAAATAVWVVPLALLVILAAPFLFDHVALVLALVIAAAVLVEVLRRRPGSGAGSATGPRATSSSR